VDACTLKADAYDIASGTVIIHFTGTISFTGALMGYIHEPVLGGAFSLQK
jgi:hypothetical protein